MKTKMKASCLLILSLVVTAGADPRLISYEDLMMSASRFSEPGVTTYSQLLFDISRSQVLVGAKDTLLRLTLKGLEKLEKAVWQAPPDKVQLCQDKGQTEPDCHNFIKVLLTNGKKLFTCGTNAFSPQCSWREMEEVNRVTEWVRGVAKCPYSPHSNITAVLTETTGQYFAGSPMDFSGADAAITRDLGPSSNSYLRTNQYNSKWLNDPQFVGSFETDQFVYFLFRESAVEFINCGKVIYSRISRVCKNDNGGQLMLRDNWTTFVKARLNCSLPGEYPFYFDNIQGMTYLPEQGIIYATFTTPSNSIPGSAICSFNMSSIQAAFNGAFKHQSSVRSTWERQTSSHPARHTECTEVGSHQLLDSSRYQLMDSPVQPTTLRPLYDAKLETLTHIAADVIPTKLHKAVHVLYVATIEGLVKKISVITRTQETCVLEVWKPFPNENSQPIHTLKFAMESLYIGLEDSVVRVPSSHCRRHKSKTACINSMDPYCGWHDHNEKCITAPNDNPLTQYWHQEATQCPLLNQPVDGGWSAWSPWVHCQHATSSDSSDTCLCSTRSCNNPTPSHGGAACSGIHVRVSNCTLHGGWSSWSGWSACSQSCGMAVKTRRRSCGNPQPQFGGRVCVGQDRQEMYCHSNPPCPTVTSPVRDGSWSSWSNWGECSARCGGGFRVRTRECNNPPPQGGQDCPGCKNDYQPCNIGACVESRRMSSWTQWVPSGNGTEKRFRFSCRAPTPDPALIKVTQFKVEDRNCTTQGVCTRSDRGEAEEAWSEWSAWSPCSVECGEGQQFRVRTCEGRPEDCRGPSRLHKACNQDNCRGEWGCWTDWSECSVSCGVGMRQRTRECMHWGSSGPAREAQGCPGSSISQQHCEMPSCHSLPGWNSWSDWSVCDSSGEQYRSRLCLTSSPGPDLCQGSDRENRICPLEQTEGEDESGVGVKVLVMCSILMFIIGGLSAGGVWYFVESRRRVRVPGSPHYISSKQNPYVTVPLKEVHSPKRTPSFRGQPSPTPKLFAKSGGEYETATIKRNSHSLANGHGVRADLEQDKFF